MNIALIYPKWTISYFARRISIWPPLGLLSLAAVSEKIGHKVMVIDAEAERLNTDKVLNRLSTFNPDLIGFTGTTPFYHLSAELAREIKFRHPKIPIAIGGNHVTIMKEEAFYPCFDYGFVGESEESWREFLTEGKPVKGMLYRHNGYTVSTGHRDYIDDLDTLPFPSHHLVNMKKYHIGTRRGVLGCTSIMFSRGCPFQCIFCNTGTFGRVVRYHSVDYVLRQLWDIVSRFRIRHFAFADDNLTINRKYIMELCESIISSGLKITFESSTRANLVDEELINILVKAGLIRLSFGLESANEYIRDIAKKNIPLESYTEAARLCNHYGVEVIYSVMLGLPGETRQTIKETVDYLKQERNVHEVAYNIAVPYPGTELLEMAKHQECGLSLLSPQYSQYSRHKGVMKVGNLMPKDLVIFQDKGYGDIHAVLWRISPMIKRAGFLSFLLTYWRGIKGWWAGRSLNGVTT